MIAGGSRARSLPASLPVYSGSLRPAWTQSASAMPPRQLRICRRLVMRSPEQHLIQALDLYPELGSGVRRQHEQSFLQLVPSPAFTTARTGELGLFAPPTALGAVDVDGPDAQRHRHDARAQTFPFQHADGRIRGSRQSRDIAIAHPGTSPAALTRPKGSWSSTRHGPFGHQSWAAWSHSRRPTGQGPGRSPQPARGTRHHRSRPGGPAVHERLHRPRRPAPGGAQRVPLDAADHESVHPVMPATAPRSARWGLHADACRARERPDDPAGGCCIRNEALASEAVGRRGSGNHLQDRLGSRYLSIGRTFGDGELATYNDAPPHRRTGTPRRCGYGPPRLAPPRTMWTAPAQAEAGVRVRAVRSAKKPSKPPAVNR